MRFEPETLRIERIFDAKKSAINGCAEDVMHGVDHCMGLHRPSYAPHQRASPDIRLIEIDAPLVAIFAAPGCALCGLERKAGELAQHFAWQHLRDLPMLPWLRNCLRTPNRVTRMLGNPLVACELPGWD